MGALPNAKISMFFDEDPQGFSESHFTQYTTIAGGSSSPCYKAMLALAQARVLIVDGKNVTLTSVRASIDDVNRDRQLLLQADVPTKNAAGTYTGGVQAGTAPWAWQTPHVSWVVDMDTVKNGVNPTLYIAGMPANTGQLGNNAFTATPRTPGDLLTTYLDLLVSGPYGCAYRQWINNPPDPGTSYEVATTTWGAAAGALPNTFTFTSTALDPFPVMTPGTYVRLWGATYTSILKRQRYNGTYKVLNSTTLSLQVAAPRVTIAPTWGLLGYIQPSTMAYTAYTGYNIRGITHRKRGRPTSAARGRR